MPRANIHPNANAAPANSASGQEILDAEAQTQAGILSGKPVNIWLVDVTCSAPVSNFQPPQVYINPLVIESPAGITLIGCPSFDMTAGKVEITYFDPNAPDAIGGSGETCSIAPSALAPSPTDNGSVMQVVIPVNSGTPDFNHPINPATGKPATDLFGEPLPVARAVATDVLPPTLPSSFSE